MKASFAVLAAASLASLASAVPVKENTLVARENWEKKTPEPYHKEDDYKKDDKKYDDKKHDGPFWFTSTYVVYATPDTIINNNQTAVPGVPGASGTYKLGINSEEEYICYNIEFFGYPEGFEYQSPAATATHIHEAPVGRAGPPRIAFPNPEYDSQGRLRSLGCLSGPFRTGLNAAGTDVDTGVGFTLSEIEANPAGFFADNHVAGFAAGAIRGQLA